MTIGSLTEATGESLGDIKQFATRHRITGVYVYDTRLGVRYVARCLCGHSFRRVASGPRARSAAVTHLVAVRAMSGSIAAQQASPVWSMPFRRATTDDLGGTIAVLPVARPMPPDIDSAPAERRRPRPGPGAPRATLTEVEVLARFERHMRTAKLSPVTIDDRLALIGRLSRWLPAGLLAARP